MTARPASLAAATTSPPGQTQKLNTPRPLSRWLETLAAHGAPETILWDAKPHVGTDYLRRALTSLRRELLELGCDIRFGCRLTGLALEGNRVRALDTEGPEGPCRLTADHVALAPGNSARDTFQMLHAAGAPLEPKALAVGGRPGSPE